jgi:uroporphyrinogen decarboxylase
VDGLNRPVEAAPASRFLRACRRMPVDRTPVWFMRQAGRYMPEYRALREKYSLLEICRQPELAAEVTLQPVHLLGVDAAILFADILLPLIPMGVDIEFVRGDGPVIHNPIRSQADIARLRPIEAEQALGHVMRAVHLVRQELPREIALIGFAGAPFTLASYLVEGGASRDFLRTKRLMYNEGRAWRELMEKLSAMLTDYLVAQVRAGAQAVQLFDSWVGALSPEDYRDYVQPYSASVLQGVSRAGVPVIHFGTGTATLLEDMREAGGDVIGVDWRIPLDRAWERLGPSVAIQGNLDPAALFAPRPELERQVRRILQAAAGRPGHVFNLGHGILPETPVENAQAVVEMVHKFSVREAA